ncbi:MAG: TIGR03617 family F420-dependent LLM class oxidoreductase [Gammaproteobacteria bacterium]
MRIATTVLQDDLRKVAAAAAAAERDGYTVLTTLENKHDPFLPLAIAAVNTQRIELCTSVAIAFPRSPMTVAQMGWDLNEASRGRFVLGLGTQVKAHNERRFSVPWSAPAPRIREYVQALRAIWRCWRYGEKLQFQGEHYRFTLMTPHFVPESQGLRVPPVTVAAVGPAMLRVAGEVADGVRLHPFCTRRYFDEVVLPELGAGLARSGRDRSTFEISGGGFIATGPDDAAVHARREWVRGRIGFYASTPAYHPVLERHGLLDLGLKLNRLTRENAWDRLAGEVSDDVLDLFVISARHDRIKAEIERHAAGRTDTIYASANSAQPGDMPPDLIQEIARLKTPFEGWRGD